QLHAVDLARRALLRAHGDRGGAWDLDREPRSLTDQRCNADLVVEHARDALDDRKPEPQAAGDLGALLEAMKFLEDRALLRVGNAKPGIAHVDAQPSTVAPATDQHAALRRVLDGVRDEILQQ